MQTRFTIPEMQAFMAEVFPQMAPRLEVLAIEPFFLRAAMGVGEADLRPGGTVSGPTIFALADCAFYMATLAMIGREALAVTTSAAIDFMRKPAPGRLTAEARILKLGRTLAVGDVHVLSPGVEGPVARASLTYAIPPQSGAGRNG